MKNNFLRIIYFLSYYLGINRFFYFLNRNRQRVITFHNIIPDILFDDSIHLGVSCTDKIFEFQIKEIKKRLNITTELGVSNSCIITFDDGYLNQFYIAHNILKKFSYKAIFFINSDLVKNKKVLWIDKLLMYFSYLPNGTYSFCNQNFLINTENRFASYVSAYKFILSYYHLKDEFINQLDKYESLINIDSKLENLRFKPLYNSHIDIMKNYGHLVGCHSTSHEVLLKLNKDKLEHEINTCENLIGTFYNCDYFSYPFGSDKEVDQRVVKKMQKSVFTHCFINNWFYKYNNDDYKIQRMSLPNLENKYLIHAYLSGFYFYLKQFIDD
tara:strand:+ start:4181 stop:5161 length:981 start_codon:yes stop_codon:yes gene_type:complete